MEPRLNVSGALSESKLEQPKWLPGSLNISDEIVCGMTESVHFVSDEKS